MLINFKNQKNKNKKLLDYRWIPRNKFGFKKSAVWSRSFGFEIGWFAGKLCGFRKSNFWALLAQCLSSGIVSTGLVLLSKTVCAE